MNGTTGTSEHTARACEDGVDDKPLDEEDDDREEGRRTVCPLTAEKLCRQWSLLPPTVSSSFDFLERE
jgi:hypothetical protein